MFSVIYINYKVIKKVGVFNEKDFEFFFVAFLIVLLGACSKPGGLEEQNATGQETEKNTSSRATELEPEEGAELVIWGEEAEWTKYVAGEFTDKFGIPVTFEEVSHTDAAGKLEIDGPAGVGGDVFTGAHNGVGEMVEYGLIYDNYFAIEYQKRLMEDAVTAVSANINEVYKMFGYPLAIETVSLFYNKDLLDQMGFKPAETMEELLDQSKEFKGENPGSYGFMIEPSNFYLIHGFLGGYGGYIFGKNNTNPDDIGLNNEGGQKAAELMKKIHGEILPLKKEDITGEVISSYFNEGKLLYYITGPWAIKGHQEAGINFGIKTMPKLENGEIPKTFSSVKSLFVNAYSKYPKAATLFAQFATTDEMLLKRYEITGELPPSNALLEEETIKSDKLNVAFIEQLKYSISMPNIPAMKHVWAGMDEAFTTLWNGESEPKAALDKGVKEIRDAINSRTK